MKGLFIILPITIAAFCSEAQTSKVELENGAILTFDYSASPADKSRRLTLNSRDRIETVWESNQLEPVVINGYREKGGYEKIKLTGASVEARIIAVVFELTPGRQRLVPAHALDPYFAGGIIPKTRSKRDFLVRVFVRESGLWIPQLSFYPQTFFGDTVDEPIEAITVNDESSIDIKYSGSWLLVGRGEDKYIPGGPFKYRTDEGLTVKKFRYSGRKHLLFVEDVQNQKKYIDRSIWWTNVDGFDSSDLGEKVEFSAIIGDQRRRVAENGSVPVRFRYLAKLPEAREKRYQDAIEYLVEQKKNGDR